MKKHTHFFLRPVRNTAFMFTACAQTQSKNNLKRNHYWYFQNLKIHIIQYRYGKTQC
jgi:hypothetical protein